MRKCPLVDEPKFAKHAARDPAAAQHQLLTHVDDAAAPLLGTDFLGDGHGHGYGGGGGGGASDSAGGGGSANSDDHLLLDVECPLSPSDAASSRDGSSRGSEREREREPTPLEAGAKAAALLAAGTALCAVFSDPLVGAVADVARASGVPAFPIAFVFMPLASNASELVSSLAFAASKTSNHISASFNQVYGAVVLNSTLCLGCFLAVLYHQRLPFAFGPEVAVILVPTLLLGSFAARRRTWPAAWGVGALALYPGMALLQLLLSGLAGGDDRG